MTLTDAATGLLCSHSLLILFHMARAWPAQAGRLATRWDLDCRSPVSHHQHLSESILCILPRRYDPIAASFFVLRRCWRRRHAPGEGLYRYSGRTLLAIHAAEARDLASVWGLDMCGVLASCRSSSGSSSSLHGGCPPRCCSGEVIRLPIARHLR